MPHNYNSGYAVVDSDPNSIPTLQSGHKILIAAHEDGNTLWKFVEGNSAGSKWVELKTGYQAITEAGTLGNGDFNFKINSPTSFGDTGIEVENYLVSGNATSRLNIKSVATMTLESQLDGIFMKSLVNFEKPLQIRNAANTFQVFVPSPNITNNRTIEFPDKSGTIALTSDIPSGNFVPYTGATQELNMGNFNVRANNYGVGLFSSFYSRYSGELNYTTGGLEINSISNIRVTASPSPSNDFNVDRVLKANNDTIFANIPTAPTVTIADINSAGVKALATKEYVDANSGSVDLSGLVPYTGATNDVDLGDHTLKLGKTQEIANKARHINTLLNIVNQPLIRQQSHYWNGSSFQTTLGHGSGIFALANNTGRDCSAFGPLAMGDNTGNFSNGFGYDSLRNNSGANSNGFGTRALFNNTGPQSNGFGYEALHSNTGNGSNGFGYQALRNNTGTQCSGVGLDVLQNNSGIQCNGFGRASLAQNTGANSNGYGSFSLAINTGITVDGFGYNTLQYNTRNLCAGFGSAALRYNEGINNTALGSQAGAIFNENTGNIKTVANNATDINVVQNRITLTAHGLGSVGQYTLLKYNTTGTQIIGLGSNIIYKILIVDANTIEFPFNFLASTGGTATHTFTPQFVYSNVTLLGYNSQPTKSNQVVLGNLGTEEVYTDGVVKSNANLSEITDDKHLISKEYFEANSDTVVKVDITNPVLNGSFNQELIPAPGADKVIIIKEITMRSNVTTLYSDDFSFDLNLTSFNSIAASMTATVVNDTFYQGQTQLSNGGVDTSSLNNQALNLTSTVNATTNGQGTFTLWITYKVIDIS